MNEIPKDEGSYEGPFAIEVETSDGWIPAITGVRQLPLRCADRQTAYERALKIIRSGRNARVVEPYIRRFNFVVTVDAASHSEAERVMVERLDPEDYGFDYELSWRYAGMQQQYDGAIAEILSDEDAQWDKTNEQLEREAELKERRAD